MGVVRFLLALCVVVTHAPGGTILGVRLLNGIVAVQSFYVISGFLITMILNERKQYRKISNFYLSRYLRLWPVYIIVALLSFLFTTGAALRSLIPPDYRLPTLIYLVFEDQNFFRTSFKCRASIMAIWCRPFIGMLGLNRGLIATCSCHRLGHWVLS